MAAQSPQHSHNTIYKIHIQTLTIQLRHHDTSLNHNIHTLQKACLSVLPHISVDKPHVEVFGEGLKCCEDVNLLWCWVPLTSAANWPSRLIVLLHRGMKQSPRVIHSELFNYGSLLQPYLLHYTESRDALWFVHYATGWNCHRATAQNMGFFWCQ